MTGPGPAAGAIETPASGRRRPTIVGAALLFAVGSGILAGLIAAPGGFYQTLYGGLWLYPAALLIVLARRAGGPRRWHRGLLTAAATVAVLTWLGLGHAYLLVGGERVDAAVVERRISCIQRASTTDCQPVYRLEVVDTGRSLGWWPEHAAGPRAAVGRRVPVLIDRWGWFEPVRADASVLYRLLLRTPYLAVFIPAVLLYRMRHSITITPAKPAPGSTS